MTELVQRLERIFACTMDPRQMVRSSAEDELERIQQEPDVVEGILATFTQSSSVDIRQMSIALQKYINTHWSEAAEKFQPPLIADGSRPVLRRSLFEGLGESKEILRNASAYAVALIGKYDWPTQWPSLMSDLITLLRQGSKEQTEGALHVVVELMKETLDEDQLPAITTELLPVLLEIVNNEQLHWQIRQIPIKVFEDVIGMLSGTMRENYQAVEQTLNQVVPVWMETLGRFASADIDEVFQRDPGLLGLSNCSFSAFATLESNFPKYFATYRPNAIRMSVYALTRLIPYHWRYSVVENGADAMPNDYDPDLVFGTLALEILVYLAPSCRAKSVKSLLIQTEGEKEAATPLLLELVRSVAAVMQVTDSYLSEWDMDPKIFIVDDEEWDMSFDTRFAGIDLIGSLIDMYPQPVAAQLQTVLESSVGASREATRANSVNWWQPLEAVLTLMCALGDDIRSVLLNDDKMKAPMTVKIQELYSDVVAGLMREHDFAFIQGKAFVFAATFAPTLPHHAVEQALSASADIVVTNEVELAVKLSALKAIKLFCRHVAPSFIQPRAKEIVHFILKFLREDTKEEVLYLVLETLNAVLRVQKPRVGPSSVATLGEAVFDVWLRNATDPVATAIVEELFEMIVSDASPDIIDALVNILCPRLAVTIDQNMEVQGVPIAGEAIQLVNSLIRTRKGPLELTMVVVATASIMNCLQTTEDMDVVQHGMLHLTQIVRKDCEKLLKWQSPDGRSGIENIFALLARFLDVTFSETGAIFVGDMIIHLFRKATSSIQPILSPLLQALVTRMAGAKLPSFIESMVLPIAYLAGTGHAQPVLELLGELNVPPGCEDASAFQLVLRTWCNISDDVSGSWNIRVSALGFSALFAMPNPALREVMVRGDLIVDEANRDTIITRSRAKKTPPKYTSIPFPLKALKIILKELHLYKSNGAGKGKGKQVGLDGTLFEDDDGDEEWDDDDDGLDGADYGKGEFDYLSSWLDDGDGGGRGNDAQEDDEDLREDPVAQIDMITYLTNILRQSYATNDNGIHEMIAGLTEAEKGILKGALTV